MTRTFITRAAMLLFALLTALLCSAQGEAPELPTIPDNPNVGDLLGLYEVLYGALVVIWGYVAKALGWKTEKIPFVFVVVAGALVVGGVFLLLDLSDAITLVISFLLSLGIFDAIFKPVEKLLKQATS